MFIEPAIPARAHAFGDEHIRAHRILGPLQRIFEPVLGGRELRFASAAELEARWGVNAVSVGPFSGFPAIALDVADVDALHDLAWPGVMDELRLRLLDRQLVLHRDVPLLIFCHEAIGGGGVRNVDGGDLRRLLDRGGNPLVIISADPYDAGPPAVTIPPA